MLLGVVAAAGVGQATPAMAQGADDTPPSTMTLDRMDASARVGLQVGFNKIEDVDVGDAFVMRFEPYGQFILPNRIVGVYGMLPIAHAFIDGVDDATGVSNFDIGAFFMPYQRSNLILRVGLALPTASDTGDEVAANFISSFERTTDFILLVPDFTTLRLSVSTVQEQGGLFVRADLGLDVAIDKPSNADALFLRANMAVGARLAGVDLAFEFVNWGNLDGDDDIDERFIHTFAFGVRTRGADQFHAGLVFPLDDVAPTEFWIASIGYQRALH